MPRNHDYWREPVVPAGVYEAKVVKATRQRNRIVLRVRVEPDRTAMFENLFGGGQADPHPRTSEVRKALVFRGRLTTSWNPAITSAGSVWYESRFGGRRPQHTNTTGTNTTSFQNGCRELLPHDRTRMVAQAHLP